jgi:hypothetical protein
MAVSTSQEASRRRVITLSAVGVLAVAMVLVARVALDAVLVVALCAGVFVVQRTAGDWLSDILGARFGTLIFASVIAIFLWLLLMSGGGQSVAEQFLAAADERGFHTVFLQRQIIPPSSVRRVPEPSPKEKAPAPSADASDVANPAAAETERGSGATDASASRGARGTKNGNTVPTQLTLRLTTGRAKIGQRVIATALVRAAGETVDSGAVVFTVNGLSRTVPVKDGIATVDIVEMLSGRSEVRALYRGTRRFASASSAPALLIID